MGFKITFNEEEASQGFTLIEEGKYEATIVNAEANEWQGSYSIKFDVEIRSDVKQKHQGGKVMYNQFYMSPGKPEYEEDRKKKANTFLVACGYQGKKDLDLEVVVKEIIGKNVLVYVKHNEDKEGKLWPKVTFVAPSVTESSKKDTGTDPFAGNKGPIEVSEDDLPF